MASILDRYGIKEVCDFTFYTIDDATGKPSVPALYLDTLKVSTIEQTADTVEAKGGKGNVTLLSWDVNKEINVTVEDALFSAKSLAIMFGNGSLKSYSGASAYIMRTETFNATSTTVPTGSADASGWKYRYEGPDGKLYTKVNPKFYQADGQAVGSALTVGETYFCSYDILVDGSVVEIGANTFPGTYYCVGDTYAMNAKSGRNEFFQFIIPKAKVLSGNTITLQAEGDPSTFSMNLKVMRPDDGVMMKLVKYDAVNGTDPAAAGSTATLDHNHYMSYGRVGVVAENTTTVAVPGLPSTGATVTSSDTTVASGTASANVVTVSGAQGAALGKTATLTVVNGGTTLGTIDVTIVAQG